MIELSIALPMFKSKHIAWLALESLCRQQNIDFEWELIISEETNKEYDYFGRDEIFKYVEKLTNIGCERIEYIPLDIWVPLSKKWKLISNSCSETSKCFVLQAADCYSFPKRLKETYDIIVKKDFDYVSSQVGPFYDIKTKLAMMYDMRKRPKVHGLNMALKPFYIKNLPDEIIRRGIDSWIVKNLKKQNKKFRYFHNNSESCLHGVDTNGINNISTQRLKIMQVRKDVYPYEIEIWRYIPKDILQKLDEMSTYSF